MQEIDLAVDRWHPDVEDLADSLERLLVHEELEEGPVLVGQPLAGLRPFREGKSPAAGLTPVATGVGAGDAEPLIRTAADADINSVVQALFVRAGFEGRRIVKICGKPRVLLLDRLVALEGRILAARLADQERTETVFAAKDVAIVGTFIGAGTARLLLGTCGAAEVRALHVFAEIDLNALIGRWNPRIAERRFCRQNISLQTTAVWRDSIPLVQIINRLTYPLAPSAGGLFSNELEGGFGRFFNAARPWGRAVYFPVVSSG